MLSELYPKIGQTDIKFETVNEFLARDGQITYCPKHGYPWRQRPYVKRPKSYYFPRNTWLDARRSVYVWLDWIDDTPTKQDCHMFPTDEKVKRLILGIFRRK